ncbi:MAG: type VI secretion system tube protein Hcp [Spongiibacteraceae bacterium]
MAIYMNYNSKKIKGDVTAKGYEDWIELDSFNFGVGRGISMEVGQVANREATRPSVSEISLAKAMDASSGGLFKESVSGTEGVTVLIHLVQTGAKEIQKVAEYTLDNCLLSSYSVSASSGGAPAEAIGLSYGKIMCDLSNADRQNKNKSSMKVGYDLALGTPL